jgi:orotate phosphoribosyltransferase
MGDNHVGLSLDLAKNAKADWEASMGVPAENATGLVVDDVVVNGNSVRFTAVELQMARFDLT